MKLSQTDKNKLLDLSIEEKTEIAYGHYKDEGLSGEVALLLGSRPARAHERALAAADLYLAGRVKYIVASGGVEWDVDGKMITEADYMAEVLKGRGVPEEAIILDNDARTTKENMICGTLQINRKLQFYSINRIIIVTTEAHMRRSLALAKLFLPRKVEISGYASHTEENSRENWYKSEEFTAATDTEIRLLKGLIDNNMIDDIEY